MLRHSVSCNPVKPPVVLFSAMLTWSWVSAGGMSANIATFENFIKQSEESQGTVVTVLRQGYLHKRSSNMRREWKRRFFVLDSLGVLYYYSNKERIDNKKTRQNTVNLLTSTIKAGADEEGLRHCFRVVSPEREYVLQASQPSPCAQNSAVTSCAMQCLCPLDTSS